jgi:hypothetical protein
MSGDYLKKVQPGEPLAIPAAAYNAFIDAARAHMDSRQDRGQEPRAAFRSSGIVPIKNASGSDRSRFDVLGIDYPLFWPESDLDAFKNHPGFQGRVPSSIDHLGRFAVLLEPAPAGALARACVAGVCPAQVDVTDTAHQYADIKDGSHLLASAETGAAHILTTIAATGVQWCLVRLGVPFPIPAFEGEEFMVYQLRDFSGVLQPVFDFPRMHA